MFISKRLICLCTMSILMIFAYGCKSKYEHLDLSMYQYRETKNLVKFVYDASLMLEKDTTDGLAYFRHNRARFATQDYYLYIYDMHGTNLFHAGMRHLEGKNLRDVTDKNGKKITQLIVDALENGNNPHAWVHYSWWEPGKFYPVPKSSCHFKVKTRDGRELFVGGGMNYPHEEREFIRIIVDDAAQLLKEEGSGALKEISNPVSKYNYRDVRVFAFRADGTSLIAPAVNSSFSQTDLIECVDEVGHRPFKKALEDLESADGVWEVFMAKHRYQRQLTKKSLYVRKTLMENQAVYVAAITDLPEPPY